MDCPSCYATGVDAGTHEVCGACGGSGVIVD